MIAIALAAFGVGGWALAPKGLEPVADPGPAPSSGTPSAPIAGPTVAAPPSRTPATTTPAGAGDPTRNATRTTAPTPTSRKPSPTATRTTGAPPPPATTAPPTANPSPETRTFNSDVGTIRATCATANKSEILSWSAKKPYKVGNTKPGPAVQTFVVFRHGQDRKAMGVICENYKLTMIVKTLD